MQSHLLITVRDFPIKARKAQKDAIRSSQRVVDQKIGGSSLGNLTLSRSMVQKILEKLGNKSMAISYQRVRKPKKCSVICQFSKERTPDLITKMSYQVSLLLQIATRTPSLESLLRSLPSTPGGRNSQALSMWKTTPSRELLHNLEIILEVIITTLHTILRVKLSTLLTQNPPKSRASAEKRPLLRLEKHSKTSSRVKLSS